MKNKIIRIITLCLVFASLFALPGMAATEGGGTVDANSLNLRSAASTDSASKLLIPQGAFLIVEQKSGDWYKVFYNDYDGYVHSEYVSFSETLDGTYNGTATVTGDNVRLRASASTDSQVVSYCNAGSGLSILGVSGNWLKVQTSDGKIGYISSDYVAFGTSDSSAQTTGAQIVATAKEYLGTAYVWGGMSTSGFDCSGFVNYVYNLYGYSLNRTAQNIYSNDGTSVSKDSLQPGDILCFGYSSTSINHVGIYIGDDKFIHSSSSAAQVVITELSEGYYTGNFIGAKRIV